MTQARERRRLAGIELISLSLRAGEPPALPGFFRLATAPAKVLAAMLMLLLTNTPALAAQLLFSPDGTSGGGGSVETVLPLAKVGAVDLPRGRFTVRGDTAALTMVPEWQFDPHTVLSGKVLDTRRVIRPKSGAIVGTIFFDTGEWINYFDDASAIESVSTVDHVISGRITRVSSLDMDVQQLNGQTVAVPLQAVQSISSPRAFDFSIGLPAGLSTLPADRQLELNVNQVSLLQLGHTFRLAQLKTLVKKETNDGDLSTRKLVALGTAVSLLNLAQLGPLLGIPLGAEPILRRRAFFKEALFNSTNNGATGSGTTGASAIVAPFKR